MRLLILSMSIPLILPLFHCKTSCENSSFSVLCLLDLFQKNNFEPGSSLKLLQTDKNNQTSVVAIMTSLWQKIVSKAFKFQKDIIFKTGLNSSTGIYLQNASISVVTQMECAFEFRSTGTSISVATLKSNPLIEDTGCNDTDSRTAETLTNPHILPSVVTISVLVTIITAVIAIVYCRKRRNGTCKICKRCSVSDGTIQGSVERETASIDAGTNLMAETPICSPAYITMKGRGKKDVSVQISVEELQNVDVEETTPKTSFSVNKDAIYMTMSAPNKKLDSSQNYMSPKPKHGKFPVYVNWEDFKSIEFQNLSASQVESNCES